MSRFAGIQIGHAWAVDRLQLIQTLEQIQRGEEFQWEQRRRQRIAHFYEEAVREHPARQVQIPVTRESLDRSLAFSARRYPASTR
jgi:dTDP-4-amino-4,6-dideoxygalactose transaminase